MSRRSTVRPVLLATALAALPAPAAVAAECDPTTPPVFAGAVPTTDFAIGMTLGSRDVTTGESDRYLSVVDQASTRVRTGTLGRSIAGRPLRYAIVGRPANLTDERLEEIRRAHLELQDSTTTRARAEEIAKATPGILWIASNVHGNEESGTDASLRVLHELADRTDCAATEILDNAVVFLLPVQNPDGREADSRRSSFGFDLNRDWFARTHPETDAKIEMLRRYPPVLFVDDHEMGTPTYFFPPNADPVYHEVPGHALNWINNLYGGALQREFCARASRTSTAPATTCSTWATATRCPRPASAPRG
jgi:hypothetical protein